MSRLVDRIGGHLLAARKRLGLNLFSKDKCEGGQNEFVRLLHDDSLLDLVRTFQDSEAGPRLQNQPSFVTDRWRAPQLALENRRLGYRRKLHLIFMTAVPS